MLPTSLPVSRIPPSDQAPPLRWGILGSGWIAERFVGALHAHTTQIPYAVGSRSLTSAEAFAQAHGVGTTHGSYEQLVTDPDVDVVYVATPHNFHHDHALLAIAAGKHVVVEKPMGLSASEAEEVIAAARAAGVYCVEALWSLFLPKFDVIRQLLEDSAVGEPVSVLAELGEWFDGAHRIRDPRLAGGPMLDLGTYPVMFANWILGEADDVVALGTAAPSDVDAQFGAVLRTARGGIASLYSSIDTLTPTMATVGGTDGELVLDGPFYQPGGFTVRDHSGASLRWEEPALAHTALHFEATAAARDITDGRTESPLRPLDDTLSTLRTMDRISAALSTTAISQEA